MRDQSQRQGRDRCHKPPVPVARAFPGARCSVAEPFKAAAQRQGRVHAQQVSAAGTRKLIGQLDDKTAGAITGDAAYRSQTCPGCGRRSKHGRIYGRIDRCPKWGTTAPRDCLGALHILSLGVPGAMLPDRSLPRQVTYRRPWRKPPRRSSGGYPARSSA
jgi:transposase